MPCIQESHVAISIELNFLQEGCNVNVNSTSCMDDEIDEMGLMMIE